MQRVLHWIDISQSTIPSRGLVYHCLSFSRKTVSDAKCLVDNRWTDISWLRWTSIAYHWRLDTRWTDNCLLGEDGTCDGGGGDTGAGRARMVLLNVTLLLVTGPLRSADCRFKRDQVAFSSWRCWRSLARKNPSPQLTQTYWSLSMSLKSAISSPSTVNSLLAALLKSKRLVHASNNCFMLPANTTTALCLVSPFGTAYSRTVFGFK